MDDHAQQLERAFRFGFTAAVAAAGTRLTLSPEGLAAMEQWHNRLREWRDASISYPIEGWPDFDGGVPHDG
jgi:hypothetical protein